MNKKDFSVSKEILKSINIKTLYSSENSAEKDCHSCGEMLAVMGKRGDIEECFE